MSKINGIAKKYDGTAIDYVHIFDWPTGDCIATITPNEIGAWEWNYYGAVSLGVTYIADGCEPITHGAYNFVGEFNPIVLFNNGEQGVWFDPSDLSTLYQDTNQSIPVTADGQSVALMRDKSGNNYHATQAVSSKRPTYRTDGVLHWLDFDGVSQFMIVENSAWFDGMTAFTFQVTTHIDPASLSYSSVFGKIKEEPYAGFNMQPINTTDVRFHGLQALADNNRVVFTNVTNTSAVFTATWQAGQFFYGRKNKDAGVQSGKATAAGGMDTQGQPLLLGRLSYADTLLCKCRIYGAVIVDKKISVELDDFIDYSIEKAGITT